MPKRDIGEKQWSHKSDITGDDLIVVDEYDDQTYRLFIPGDYMNDEIDQDFATVQSIREFLGLRQHSEMEKLIHEREELLEVIRIAKIQLEQVEKQIEGVKDIKDVIPEITPRGESLLESLLILIEHDDSVFHRAWPDVRSVALDEKGVQTFGPHPMIPPREEEDDNEVDDLQAE